HHCLVDVKTAAGTSYQESSRIGIIAQRELMKLPFIRYIGQRVGRAESDDVYGPQTSELEVDLTENPPKDAMDQIRETLNAIPGIASAINTFLAERVEE